MKTTLLAIVLAVAVAAAAQDATQPQTQPAAPAGGQAQAPTIKDGAEYNAYVGAVQQTDPKAKVSGLEAFLAQYPNSVMKVTSLELLMGTYQQMNDQVKVVDAAKRLLAADSCNLRALALLTFLGRQSVASAQNAAQSQQALADTVQYSNKGLDCLKTAQKPATMSDPEFDKLKKEVVVIFNGGAGFAALQNKDYEHAQQYLRAAVEADPNDIQNVYPLAMAYLTPKPPDSLNGLFFIARAVNLAGPGGKDQIQTYGQKVYKNYHGSDAGWTDVIATAKTSPLPPAGFNITQYVPPTPAEQAHDLVKDKTPDQIKQLSFGEWELVLSAGSQEDQDKVWNVIKGVPLQMEGTVLSASTPAADPPSSAASVLQIAASEDDIEQKKADITVTMSGAIPARTMPKEGATLDFEGTPVSYVPTPFMMTMEKGALLKKAGARPAPKPPVHHRPVRKPQ
jgi:tetratricopeptide (TPR) repeat protein